MAGENRTPGILLELRRMSRPERDLQLGASTFAGGALDRRTRMLLGHYLEQGMSKRALARKFGIRPDTLYRWIREVTSTGISMSTRFGMVPDLPYRPSWIRTSRSFRSA